MISNKLGDFGESKKRTNYPNEASIWFEVMGLSIYVIFSKPKPVKHFLLPHSVPKAGTLSQTEHLLAMRGGSSHLMTCGSISSPVTGMIMPTYSVFEDKVGGITKPLSTYSLCTVRPAAFWDSPSHIHHRGRAGRAVPVPDCET